MTHLIYLIISIALMSSMTGLAIKYVPSDAYQRQKTFQGLMQGLGSMNEATVRYLQDTRKNNLEGVIEVPHPDTDLQATIFPAFGFIPAPIGGELTWQVTSGQVPWIPGQDLYAIGLCAKPLNGNVSALTKNAMALAQAQMPQGSTFIGSGCNATQNGPNGDHLTYWVVLSHLD